MKLIAVSLHGYKRFEQHTSMNVDGKLVAVVGPNESGKSSFLNALMHLNGPSSFVASGGSRELTRNAQVPADQTVVEARYLLEDVDREAISHIQGTEEARWFTVGRKAESTNFWCGIEPRPQRSLQPRQRMVQALKATSARKGFLELVAQQEEENLRSQVENLVSSLDVSAETLTDESRNGIRSVVAMLESSLSDEDPKYLHRLVQQLHDLADHEEGDPFHDAINILVQRRSRFLLFSDEERALQSEYSLNEEWEDPPAALRNLARVAELDLEALHLAVEADDSAQIASLQERANDKLKNVFSENWSQSSVAVTFRVNGQVLQVLMREPQARYTTIDERSDGLRQFVALLAFATLKGSSDRVPILLIDEAETHLHYDAQADLVQMLTRQDVVSKVIYTTHSIGCLPEDLGTGVRLVETKDPDSRTSTIRNWFWQSTRPGFSPLLFGMGASTLAFIPIRHAVIAEGISDIILWPTLLREATGLSHLDFQVVPGLSEADRSEILRLDSEAPNTAYLLDADEGGGKKHKQLTKAGVSVERIFCIPDAKNQGLVVEDLVDPQLYLGAVNEELQRTNGPGSSFPKGKLPVANRPKAISEWCKTRGIEPPSKRAVAYQVLEHKTEMAILAGHYSRPLRELYVALRSLFEGGAL
jgi:predicted ATP-dependent endonuclease of OLD family